MAGWWLRPQWWGFWLLRLPGTSEYLSPYPLYLDSQFRFVIFIATLSFVHVGILTVEILTEDTINKHDKYYYSIHL